MKGKAGATGTQLLYRAAGFEIGESDKRCWLCGGSAFEPMLTKEFIKPTFTDHDKVACPESRLICAACIFCCAEQSELLASLIGKDKPQRMRNYSHFVVNGRWIPLSKGDKTRMAELLLQQPELAIIAVSGQKHIIFRAQPGWWQIEEQSVLPFPDRLREWLTIVESLYVGFSKSEIESGHYAQHRVTKFGLSEWWALESQIRQGRGGLPLRLAIFLAQKGEMESDTGTRTGSESVGNLMERDTSRLQGPLPDEHLETV